MKKTISLNLIFSALIFFLGVYILKFYNCGTSIFCYHLQTQAFALYYGGGSLLLIAIILFFVPKAFSMWKKFAIWFLPLAALLFVFYPNPGSGDYFSPYPEQIFQWVSGLYVIISLIIIGWTAFQKS